MADIATERISEYVQTRGIKISAISRETGIPDGILRRSLSAKERDLRADEFLGICEFLHENPTTFWKRRSQDTA